MNIYYPIQVIHLRFQVDHISPESIQLLEENRNFPDKARRVAILVRPREIKMISDGN